MTQMGRPGMSAQEKAELWRRWKHGESLSDIARVLKKGGGSIFGVLRLQGGIAPTRAGDHAWRPLAMNEKRYLAE